MKHVRLVPLTVEDIKPYMKVNPVVRHFSHQDFNWYVGYVLYVELHDTVCDVSIRPFVRYGHGQKTDPQNPGQTLITDNDKPFSNQPEKFEIFKSRELHKDAGKKWMSLNEVEELKLTEPLKVTDRYSEKVLIIESKEGTTIFSHRAQDLKRVQKMITIALSFPNLEKP